MNTLVALILEIEKRPALYIGKNYISCLKSFIDGWCLGNKNIEDVEVLGKF